MIRRGTTPTARFVINGIQVENLKDIYITFKQGNIELTKTGGDVMVDLAENALEVKLSQEETLKFYDDNQVHVQIRAKTYSDDVIASQVISDRIEKILMNGVI